MKIYTEINYKWLDGQLVKTSSKSFEYKGNLTLCGGGGGAKSSSGSGGGLDFSDPVGSVTASVQSVTGDDPVGAASEAVADVVGDDPVGAASEIVGDSIGDDPAGALSESLQSVVGDDPMGEMGIGGEDIAGGLADGVSGMGMNEGIATTLTDMGDNIQTNMAPLVSAGGQFTDAMVTNLQYGSEYLGETMGHLSDFIHNPKDQDPVTIDPDQFAVDSAKRKKNKSDLAMNKAKKRNRKSLRIG